MSWIKVKCYFAERLKVKVTVMIFKLTEIILHWQVIGMLMVVYFSKEYFGQFSDHTCSYLIKLY